MSRVERDPERGRAAAAKLRALGVKGILITAAEQGYITQVACKMPECFCPEELGGACHFEPVTHDWSDWRSDWMPTHEHFPLSKKDGGHRKVDNAILAHRLCNRIDHHIREGLGYARDLERVRKAREEAIRRNKPHPVYVQAVAEFLKRLLRRADMSGERFEESEASKSEETPKAKKSPEWKSLPDDEKAEYLLTHPTLSDRTWTSEPRLTGEKRDAFIRRVLLGEASDSDPAS